MTIPPAAALSGGVVITGKIDEIAQGNAAAVGDPLDRFPAELQKVTIRATEPNCGRTSPTSAPDRFIDDPIHRIRGNEHLGVHSRDVFICRLHFAEIFARSGATPVRLLSMRRKCADTQPASL